MCFYVHDVYRALDKIAIFARFLRSFARNCSFLVLLVGGGGGRLECAVHCLTLHTIRIFASFGSCFILVLFYCHAPLFRRQGEERLCPYQIPATQDVPTQVVARRRITGARRSLHSATPAGHGSPMAKHKWEANKVTKGRLNNDKANRNELGCTAARLGICSQPLRGGWVVGTSPWGEGGGQHGSNRETTHTNT